MDTSRHILLIEDDDEVAGLLATSIANEIEDVTISTACSATAGLEHIAAHQVDCVLLDYRLPDSDGLECLCKIRTHRPDLPVIMITGAGSERVAVEAMKGGAIDYLVKHGPYHRTVAGIIRDAWRAPAANGRPMKSRPRATRSMLAYDPDEPHPLARIIGGSKALTEAVALAQQAAHSRASVLIEGETGTGKELFARAIHAQSDRGSGPFVALNCAALPATLMESELFGHVRGAFTGADRDRRGLFEEADGGTLFLDEIGDMASSLQAALLRVIEDGYVRPLGTSRGRRVDVRLIAASNRDLESAARSGQFRPDLLYRLRVFPIRLPPLRERPEDIEALSVHFLARHAAAERKPIQGLHPDALIKLRQFAWPGNVRELHNEIHRVVLVAQDQTVVGVDLLSPSIRAAQTYRPVEADRQLKDVLREVEVATVQSRLERYRYHRTATARSLGITREALWMKLRTLGIPLARRRPGSSEPGEEP